MIVICEECGKKYRIDTSKIGKKGAQFKCKACNSVVRVLKEETAPLTAPEPPTELAPVEKPPEQHHEDRPEPEPVSGARPEPEQAVAEPDPDGDRSPEKRKRRKQKRSKSKHSVKTGKSGVGIRTKMLLLFLAIPIAIIGAASYLYLDRLSGLSSLLIGKSAGMMTEMSESIIAETARSAASQCGLYLEFHPALTRESFDGDFAFRRLAQKKIGITGYTFLISIGGDDDKAVIWVHPNPKVIGRPLSEVMKEDLGRNYPKFENIVKPVETGTAFESGGYFTQRDADGKPREKYIAVTPIEGTDFAVAAATFIDEFTLPVSHLERDAQRTAEKTRNFIVAVLGCALVFIGLVVTIYSASLSGKIKKLTDIANRISVGELDEEIDLKATDEIGALAEAISRMQDSIRLSIERLRRRR